MTTLITMSRMRFRSIGRATRSPRIMPCCLKKVQPASISVRSAELSLPNLKCFSRRMKMSPIRSRTTAKQWRHSKPRTAFSPLTARRSIPTRLQIFGIVCVSSLTHQARPCLSRSTEERPRRFRLHQKPQASARCLSKISRKREFISIKCAFTAPLSMPIMSRCLSSRPERTNILSV